ncbi:hypothetical protein [Streptomyces qinzhouensis]|nr:hypothetical protein [Streptomyces qinzhouensis]
MAYATRWLAYAAGLAEAEHPAQAEAMMRAAHHLADMLNETPE